MDAEGFGAKLQSLGLEEGEIRTAISLARRFEAYVASQPAGPAAAAIFVASSLGFVPTCLARPMAALAW